MKYQKKDYGLLIKKTELEIELARTTDEKEFYRKKLYYYKNREIVLEKQKQKYQENPNQKKQYQKEYNENNREIQNAKKIERYNKLKQDPEWLEKEIERLREYKKRNRERLREKGKEYRENNKEKRRDTQFKYRLKNKNKLNLIRNDPAYVEKQRAWSREWKEKNSEKMKEKRKEWKKKNKELVSWHNSQRNEKLKRATIGGNMFKDQILKIYKEKYRLNEETGVVHHTDHQIPLCNPTVCGLNVPWNMENIPAVNNLKKSNKLDPSTI